MHADQPGLNNLGEVLYIDGLTVHLGPVDDPEKIEALVQTRNNLLTKVDAVEFHINRLYAKMRREGRIEEAVGLGHHGLNEIVTRTRKWNSATGSHERWGDGL